MTGRERNRRARAYSRQCRNRRLVKAAWFLAAVLAAALLVTAIWAASGREAEELGAVESPAEAVMEQIPPEAMETAWNAGVFQITGYCACCTPYAGSNRNGDGLVLTASGEWVEIGTCVAVDISIIPLGSEVMVDGVVYRALDTGVSGHVIDILMSHEDAHRAGVREVEVLWR